MEKNLEINLPVLVTLNIYAYYESSIPYLLERAPLSKLAPPFWREIWAPPSNERPSFLSKEAFFWKIVY